MSINIPENLEKTVATVAENAVAPLSKNAGTTFADIWYLVFGGISQAVEKRKIKYAADLEIFKTETEKRISQIKDDDIKGPDVQISGQALEKSKYCIEHEELRSMFSSLIASSMMKSKEKYIHPSFAEIITQLSPADAVALKAFETNNMKAIINIMGKVKRENIGGGNLTLFKNIWYPYNTPELLLTSSKISSSLSRLGLVEISYREFLVDDSLYEKIYDDDLKSYVNQRYIDRYSNIYGEDIQKGYISLTALGENFLKCVL